MLRKDQKGFSLVELLASIAIIGLLASITYAGFNAVREFSEKAECASNLRQLGMATLLYCNEHNGQFPKTTHDHNNEESWVYTLAPYTEDVDDIRISPGDPMAEQRLENRVSSYLMNEYIAVVERDFVFSQGGFVVTQNYTNIKSLPNPTKTIVVFTGADNLPPTISYDHTHSRNWTNYTAATGEIQTDRHSSGANYLYADGHVAYILATELEATFAEGTNIAEPPSF